MYTLTRLNDFLIGRHTSVISEFVCPIAQLSRNGQKDRWQQFFSAYYSLQVTSSVLSSYHQNGGKDGGRRRGGGGKGEGGEFLSYRRQGLSQRRKLNHDIPHFHNMLKNLKRRRQSNSSGSVGIGGSDCITSDSVSCSDNGSICNGGILARQQQQPGGSTNTVK